MKQKINCQIFNILLNNNKEFTNKYSAFISGDFDLDTLFEDYYKNKNMTLVQIDIDKQSICFSNQKKNISFYNIKTKKEENYFEEIHIHCNSLFDFDNLINFLKYSDCRIVETNELPHYNKVYNEDFKNYELVMIPMTNEVAETKKLINILTKKSPELIFRALAIHFGELVNDPKEIDSKLIHKLDNIYSNYVVYSKNFVFSEDIANMLLALLKDEADHNLNVINNKNVYEFNQDEIDYSMDNI